MFFQGAEAKVYTTTFLNKTVIVKDRFEKTYRLKELDKSIRKSRMLSEAKCIKKAFEMANVNTPTIYYMDMENTRIFMEKLEGITLKRFILDNENPKRLEEIAKELGSIVARLHSNHIIHGDLTTSNIIVGSDGLSIIDFGLAEIAQSAEKKAVDLWIMKRTLSSSHIGYEWLIDVAINEYIRVYALKDLEKIKQRLALVQQRYRKMQ